MLLNLRKEKKEKALKDYTERMESKRDDENSFTNKSLFRIINNVQVKISNIHLRFEDDGKISNLPPFAFGVTLQELSAHSADGNWNFVSVGVDSVQARKAITLQGFGLYWQTDLSNFNLLGKTQGEIERLFLRLGTHHLSTGMQFIIAPLSATARVILNKKASALQSEPRYSIDVQIHPIACTLTRSQYSVIIEASQYVIWTSRRQHYQDLRPSLPIHKNAIVWWRFAANSILKDFRRRTSCWSWAYIRRRMLQRKAYINAFTLILEKSAHTSQIEEIATLDAQLDVVDIIRYRNLSRARFNAKTLQKSKSGIFGGWFRSNTPEVIDAAEERKQLLQILENDTEFDEIISKSAVDLIIHLKIEAVLLNLHDDISSPPLIGIQAHSFDVALSRRPAANSIKIITELQTFLVAGRNAMHQTSPMCSSATEDSVEPLITLAFESNPLVDGSSDIHPDLQLRFKLSPMKWNVSLASLLAVVRFFEAPQSVTRMASTIVASQLKIISSQSRTGLQHIIDNRKVLDLSLSIRAPIIILTATDDMNEQDEPCFIFDLGTLNIQSLLRKPPSKLETLSDIQLSTLAYDTFSILSDDMTFSLSTRKCADAPTSHYRILDRFQAQLFLDQSLEFEDVSFPKFKISCSLPLLSLRISDYHIYSLVSTIDSMAMQVKLAIASYGLHAIDKFELDLRHTSSSHFDELEVDVDSGDEDTFYDAVEDLNNPDASVRQQPKYRSETDPLVMQKQLTGTFIIKQFEVHLQQQNGSNSSATDFLLLKMQNLSANIQTRALDQSLFISLQQIQLLHVFEDTFVRILAAGPCLQFDESQTLSDLVPEIQDTADSSRAPESRPPSSGISASIILSEINHPLLETHFNAILAKTVVSLGSVHITINRDSLFDLLRIILRMKEKYISSLSNQSNSFLQQQKVSKPLLGHLSKLDHVSCSTDMKSDITKIMVQLHVSQILVDMHAAENIPLLHLQLQDICFQHEQSLDNSTLIDASIGELELKDSTAQNGFYDIVLASCDEQRTQIIISIPSSTDLPIVINLAADRVKCVVCWRFIGSIINFIESLPIRSPEASSPASKMYFTASNDGANSHLLGFARQAVGNIQDSLPLSSAPSVDVSTRSLDLQVKINAPLLVFPRLSVSQELLVINLGSIALSTLNVSESHHDEFSVDICNLQAYMTTLTDLNSAAPVSNFLCHPTSISLGISQVLNREGPVTIDSKISVEIAKIHMDLNVTEYRSLLTFFSDNFSEAPVVFPSSRSPDTLKSHYSASNDSAPSLMYSGDDIKALTSASNSNFTLSLSISNIVINLLLDLINSEGSFQSAKGSPFISLSLNDTNVRLEVLPREPCKLRIEAALGSFEAIDERETTKPAYRRFLSSLQWSSQSENSNAGFLKLQFEINRNNLRILNIPSSVRGSDIEALLRPEFPEAIVEAITLQAGSWISLISFPFVKQASGAFDTLTKSAMFQSLGQIEYGLPSGIILKISSAGLLATLSPELLFRLSESLTPPPRLEVKEVVRESISRSNSFRSNSSENTLAPFEEVASLPKITDALELQGAFDKVSLHFTEDIESMDSRSFLLECALQSQLIKQNDQEVVDLMISKLHTSSFQSSSPNLGRIHILVSENIQLNARKTLQGDISLVVDCPGIDFKISYRDIKTALRLAKTWQKYDTALGSGQDVQWNQAVRPVVKCSPGNLPATSGGHREDIIIYLGNTNFMLINNIDEGTNPVILLSTSVNAAVRNWSSSLSITSTIAIAAAALHPEQAIWEPLFVGLPLDKRVATDIPFVFDFSLAENESRCIAASEIEIASESSCGQTQLRNGMLQGGSASNLLAALTSGVFWDSGSHRETYVVFRFASAITLSGFEYDLADELDVHHPESSVLFVADENSRNKWRQVTRIQPKLSGDMSVTSPPFRATGQFWKWSLSKKHRKSPMFIRAIRFQQSAGGKSVNLDAADGIELTLSSAVVHRIVDIASHWVSDMKGILRDGIARSPSEQSNYFHDAETSIVKGEHSCHEVVNESGTLMSYLPKGVYQPSKAIVLETGGHIQVPVESSHASIEHMLRFRDSRPITDIRVIRPAAREHPPQGYECIQRNLNADRGGEVLFLCISRLTDKIPITSIHVMFADDHNAQIPELLPDSYTRINVNLNQGCPNAREVYICYCRGTASPLVDLAVLYNNESLPKDFILIGKSLNEGKSDAKQIFLSYRRQPAKFIKQFIWPCDEEPLSDVLVLHRERLDETELSKIHGSGIPWRFQQAGRVCNLNAGNSGDQVALLSRYDPEQSPLTYVNVILAASDRFKSGPFTTIVPINLNSKSPGPELYLEYRKEPGAPIITDILVIDVDKQTIPKGYFLVPRSTNFGTPGRRIHLCYRMKDCPSNSYYFDHEDEQERDYHDSKDVMPLQSKDKHFKEEQLKAISILSSTLQIGRISFEIDGWYPVEHIKLTSVGQQFVPLHPTWQDGMARAVVDTYLLENHKVTSIHGPIVLSNQFPFPLRVCVQQKQHDRSTHLIIEPEQTVPIPIGMLDTFDPKSRVLPVYRFWNNQLRRHFYSTEPTDLFFVPHGFVEEGVLGYIYKDEIPNTVPFWIKKPSMIPDTLFNCTTNRDAITRVDRRNRKPLSRLQLEHDGYRLAGYVYSVKVEGTNPLYRCWNAIIRDNLYTIDSSEVGVFESVQVGKGGYEYEGIEGYLLNHFGTLRINSVDDDLYVWSQEVVHFNCSLKPIERKLICNPLPGGESSTPLICQVLVDPENPTKWSLSPTLEITNELLRPVFYRLTSLGNAPIQFELQPSKSRNIYEFDFSRQVHCQVYLPQSVECTLQTVPIEAWGSKFVVFSTLQANWERVSYSWRDNVHDLPYTLDLQVRIDSQQGFRHVTFYCPFYIKNHTLLPIDLTTESLSQAHLFPSNHMCENDYWMYGPGNHKFDSSSKEDTILSVGFETSRPFSLSNAVLKATELMIQLPHEAMWSSNASDEQNNSKFYISWKWGSSERLWRIVDIYPSLVFVNHTSNELYLDAGSLGEVPSFSDIRQPVRIPLDESIPINTVLVDQLWRIRSDSTLWSAAFSGHSSQETLFLKLEDRFTEELIILEAHCQHVNQHYEVHIFPNTHAAPWLIQNLCRDASINLHQTNTKIQYRLRPGEEMPYAWDQPGPRWKRSFEIAVERSTSNIIEIQEFASAPALLQYTTLNGEEKSVVAFTYTANGVSSLIVADTVSQARGHYGLDGATTFEDEQLKINFLATVPVLGISFVESHPKANADISAHDFLWVNLSGIQIACYETSLFQKIYLSLMDFQIDDQRYAANFPVIVHKSIGQCDSAKSMFSLAYVERLGQLGFGSGQNTVEYFSYLLQPISLNIENGFIAAMMHYAANLKSELENITTALKIEHTPKPKVQSFYSLIELHPIQLTLTFKLNMTDSDYNIFVRSIGVTVLNLSDVSLQLDAVRLQNVKVIQEDLLDMLLDKYIAGFTVMAYSKLGIQLVGSLEFLGDPLHTLTQLGAAVTSLFYEPAKGLIKGPMEFGEGLQKGTTAFASGVATGVTGATSKMTGAIGKGIAMLSFDDQFQRERDSMAAGASKSIVSGLQAGMTQFGKGLFAGVTGIVVAPIVEAKEGGIGGAMTGIGRGLLGLVTKPVGGAVDLIGFTLQGISGQISGKDDQPQRVRNPRFIDPVTWVTPLYSHFKADGGWFLYSQFADLRNDVYIDHVALRSGIPSILLFCLLKRLVVVELNASKAHKILRTIPINAITSRELVKEGIEIRCVDSSTCMIQVESEKEGEKVNKVLGTVLNMTHMESHLKITSKHCKFEHSLEAVKASESSLEYKAKEMHEIAVEIWENERYYPFKWTKSLFPKDPPTFSSKDDKLRTPFASLDQVVPLQDWAWITPWAVHMEHEPHDKDGWQYGPGFNLPGRTFKAKESTLDMVRRRLWSRTQRGPVS